MSDDYAYRFEYADGSAFVIYDDGRAFITFPEKDGRTRPPEQKFGKIDNRIRLLMGSVAKPRQDEIDRLRRRVVALEMVIMEEINPLFCKCDANQMLVEEIHDRAVSDTSQLHNTGE
jgi:hypothetical protein